MSEDIPGIPQSIYEQGSNEEQHLPEPALTDVQPQVDENGYLLDGTKLSYVEDIDSAHGEANASNEDRSEAALHREQGDTYHVDRGNNVARDRHNDVARALDARADVQEDKILSQAAESSGQTPENVDNPERERFEKLVELRAEAAKLATALPRKNGVEGITQTLRDIEPTNAYADRIRYAGRGNLGDQAKYDESFYEKSKDLIYAQKFGVISGDRYDAQKKAVEITSGWPDKYNRWHSSLAKTVELDAVSLFEKASNDEGKVTFTVGEAAEQLDVDGQLSRLAERLSYHTNTFYARLESSPSIVLGQDKEGNVVAKAYFIVQVGDRSSQNLETVDISAVDGVLQLASERMRPYSEEIDEGKRLASLVDLDAIKETTYEHAEERNRQFIEEFRSSAPEFDDVPEIDLYELLRIAAIGEGNQDLPEKQKLILNALKSGSKLSFVTDSSGGIVDHESIRNYPGDRFNDVFESWEISGSDKAVKTVYNGSPWSPWGRKTEAATDTHMSPADITSLRKRILDIRLREPAV